MSVVRLIIFFFISSVLFSNTINYKIGENKLKFINNHFVIDNSNVITEIPSDYKINSPYPNPFNPVLNIDLEIPDYRNININIFNIRGQLVESLIITPS